MVDVPFIGAGTVVQIILKIFYFLILSYFLAACGESKRRDKIKNKTKVDGKETSVKRPSAKGPACTSVVISDRFVVTSARCVGG